MSAAYAHRRIAAPIERVWAAATDVAGAPERISGVQRAELLAEGPFRVGSRWRETRVLLDTHGQVTGLETLGDTITRGHRRALATRDKGCAVRGCTRPPAFCDAHHLDQRADGGATDVHNLVLLCRRHHTLWHQGRLTLHQLHVPWIDGTHDPPF